MVRHLTDRSTRWRSCRQNVPDFIEPPNWPPLTHLILILWTTVLGGGSAAAGISSEDWGRWSSEASREQLHLLGHMISQEQRANRRCYWTVVQTTVVSCSCSGWTVDTLSTVSLNSGNWFWRELRFFYEKMLRLILFSNGSLIKCKTKNI